MKLLIFVLLLAGIAGATTPNLVPLPNSIEKREGTFVLSERSRIVFETRDREGMEKSLQPLAEVLASEIELLTGIKPAVVDGEAAKGDIALRFEKADQFIALESEQEQSYSLDVSPDKVVVSSAYYKGVAYGTATLLQLLAGDKVPAIAIKDGAEAAYRAVMVDVARQVHSLDVIRDVIRMSRLYKMRYVHLHLTDDQNFTFPFEPVTGKLEGNFTYTRQELLDLVAYADARGVTLIPELDLPGHSSKLKASGYLVKGESDFDVASSENNEKIGAIIDDMMSVFASSPYFHIGGDESGAGRNLVPFLKAVNERVRKAGRRLLAWEGFHGAPVEQLPAKGDDRIIVMAWESTYNAPWDLLKAGYEVINASWRPLYIVGGGNPVHPGSSAGRKFPPEEIYHWDKNTFMHWEPGRPVYEDRGPNDPVKGDHEWSATYIGKEDQMIGGQLLFWEQSQETVLNDLLDRLPPMAERLWNPGAGESFKEFSRREFFVSVRVDPIVQPVIVLPLLSSEAVEDQVEKWKAGASVSEVSDLYRPYLDEEVGIRLDNRTKIEGEIRYVDCLFSNSFGWVDFQNPATPTSEGKIYKEQLTRSGGFGIRVQLFRKDGTPVEGQTWAFFNNWKPRVKVTDYDVGLKTLPKVFDMESLPKDKIIGSYEMPMLRGPLRHTSIRGQKMESVLTAPSSGEFEISMKTQSGHATLYLDTNGDGNCDKSEILIADTPNTEKPQTAKVALEKGKQYPLRVDHNVGMPRPVVIVTLKAEGEERGKDISEFLSLPKE